MIIGHRLKQKSCRAERAGAAITCSAIAKAVAQLELASNSARLCDAELAQSLADILAQLASLQRNLRGDAL